VELAALPISGLTSIQGVGPVTIAKISERGILNLADLSRKLAFIEQLPHVSSSAKQAITQFVLAARQMAESRSVRLNPQNSQVQNLLLYALRKEALDQSIEQISAAAERCCVYWNMSCLEPSFFGFLRGKHIEAERTVNGAARFVEHEVASLGDLAYPPSRRFDELTQDEFLRAITLVNNDFDSKRSFDQSSGVAATESRIDSELLSQIQAVQLNVSHMKSCILRRYQEFGAKFIVARKYAFLGDEMGLGKTVQVLAVMSHLRASNGNIHALVIVPASLRDNWQAEIERKTDLRCHNFLKRWSAEEAVADWQRDGGIAIVAYNVLHDCFDTISNAIQKLDICVADEAQYIKNPSARRSIASRQILKRSPIAVVMTGTPVENHPKEFLAIASALDHRSAALTRMAQAEEVGSPEYFQRTVRSIYLRRNKEDVLSELPELIEIEERVSFGRENLTAHLLLINQKAHFMELRQHAIFGSNGASPKLDRVLEILDDYSKRGEKVVVFSFFRRVLDELGGACSNAAMIHGGISTSVRAQTIDDFGMPTSRYGVLLSQIDAGGVGVNLQAASAVILVEPQLNPAREYQAISRVHRMGQRRSVNVHRLFTQETVEDGITMMLARKRGLMKDYARESLLMQSTDDAISNEEVREILDYQKDKLDQMLRATK